MNNRIINSSPIIIAPDAKKLASESRDAKNSLPNNQEMLENSLEGLASISQPIIGKHKIPRYLYHVTPIENYENMLKEGFVNPKQDGLFEEAGIFMIDMVNFIKDWGSDKINVWTDLRSDLFDHVNKKSRDIVLLRIPTRKLGNLEDLKIRSQNKLFSNIDFYSDFSDGITRKNKKHITQGDNAKNASKYKQRQEAIEYIYPYKIPVNIIEKVGSVDLTKYPSNDIETVIRYLLQNTPEEKMVKLFD